MIYEDITVSGSISISGSFNVPKHASTASANQATGSLFFDTSAKLFKVFQSGAGALNVASQPFTPTPPAEKGNIQYALIAGGAGVGGNNNSYYGGGGGAGGFLSSSLSNIESGSTITVTIGAGSTYGNPSSNGSDSTLVSTAGTSFSTATAVGGGGAYYTANDGKDGGSGGGGSGNDNAQAGGSGTAGQGNDGGSHSAPGGSGAGAGSGGGGAGGPGQDRPSNGVGGNGGLPLGSKITGTLTYYAGGGGAGYGWSGFWSPVAVGTYGTNFEGGANSGGGGSYHNSITDSGDSGIAILRYPSSSIGAFGGTELKSVSGERIHKFTSSGTLVVGDNTTTPPLDNHYPSTVTKPSIFINPRALGTDGTFDTIPDYGSVGRDFHNAGGSNNTKINTAAGSYDALDTAYGSGARGFAAGTTGMGTIFSDYNTNQHHSYNMFFRYDPSMESDLNYPLLWMVKPNTASSSTSYYGGIQIAVWRGGYSEVGKIYAGLYAVSGGSNVHGTTQTTTRTSGDTWYMCTVAVTYGSSGNIKIYLNGSLEVTSSTADNTGTGGSSNWVGIGESYATTAAYNYGGMTFGVSQAWFGTALTATDVTNLWNFYKADYGLS